jgi:hypothetical protein
MSSTAADVLRALPPIRTNKPRAPEPACSSAASSSPSPVPAPDAESVAAPPPAEEQKQGETRGPEAPQEAEPATPTSEGSLLRRPAECPPAPRKPAWAPPPPPTPASKRSRPSPPSSAAPAPAPARRAFVPVARDLTTVFRALAPPKKRIRAG